MDECEVCGRRSEELFMVEIEGAQMLVCRRCSAGKEVLESFSDRQREQPKAGHGTPKESVVVVEGYGSLIRSAREALGMPAKVLAEKINEKESTLIRVEKESALPDDRLARKLERELGIRLLLKEEASGQSATSRGGGSITLGDSAIIHDRRKKGD